MTRTKLTVSVTGTACIALALTMYAFAKTELIIAKPAVRHVATWLNTNTDGLGLSRAQKFCDLMGRVTCSEQNLFLILPENCAQARSDFTYRAVAFYRLDNSWHQI